MKDEFFNFSIPDGYNVTYKEMGLSKKIVALEKKLNEIEANHIRANKVLADTAQRLIKLEQDKDKTWIQRIKDLWN